MAPREKSQRPGWPGLARNWIGRSLIDGPWGLSPPVDQPVATWLVPRLRLTRWLPYGTQESLILYGEHQDDQEISNLAAISPWIVRYAHWDHVQDMRAAKSVWPAIKIEVGYLHNRAIGTYGWIKELEETLRQVPFASLGLLPDSAGPALPIDPARGRIHLWLDTGMQEIALTTPALQAGDRLTDTFFSIFDELRAAMQPISRAGWQEMYEDNLEEASPTGYIWYWNGEPIVKDIATPQTAP